MQTRASLVGKVGKELISAACWVIVWALMIIEGYKNIDLSLGYGQGMMIYGVTIMLSAVIILSRRFPALPLLLGRS